MSSPGHSTPTQSTTVTSIQRIRPKDWSGEHKTYDLLDDDNWQSWREDINLTFTVCGLRDYIEGTLPCPDASTDAVGAGNWRYNDDYTKKIIRDRMSRGQKYHVTNCKTAQEMWSNLLGIYQTCGDQTENQLMRELTDTKAGEGDDIIAHLQHAKQLWDRITLVCPDNMPYTPTQFKKFLAFSLPPSWDEFTRQFQRDITKQHYTVPQFIGECHEEYRRRRKRGIDTVESSYAASTKPLAQRITQPAQPAQNKKKLRCTHCGRPNHKIEDCYHLSKQKCKICKKLGHDESDCRFKKKNQNSRKNKGKLVADATASKTQANVAEDMNIDEDETLTALDAESLYLSDHTYDDEMYQANLAANESSRMYDWLADSGSTHHITNRREIFSSYEPTPEATVHGVGGKIIKVLGRGTVMLSAQFGSRKRILRLERVNYIPSNKYNIFALGRWDSQGRRYQASKGVLTLYNAQDVPILCGNKISSHIYKFHLLPADETNLLNSKYYTFSCQES
jgi:hypothetical protein